MQGAGVYLGRAGVAMGGGRFCGSKASRFHVFMMPMRGSFVCVFVCAWVYVGLCLYARLCVLVSICQSVCLSVGLSVCASM